MAGSTLAEQRVVVFGAGSAGCGIAEQIVRGMMREGLDEHTARLNVHMIDRVGLLHDGMTGLLPIQNRLLQPRGKVMPWSSDGASVSFADTVEHLRPTALIGVSGQPRQFTEEIVRSMAAHVERPIIFPLSNPTSRVEAVPGDLVNWTDGRALIATGSPFAPIVRSDGATQFIAQSNNAYIFPGMGLGVLAAGARRVTDEMFMAAAEELARHSPAHDDPTASLLPPVADLKPLSRKIALAVACAAVADGVAPPNDEETLARLIEERAWEPRYRPYRRAV